MSKTLLEVKNLSVSFKTDKKVIKVINNVSFAVNSGETLGIVGESGCGKSVTAHSIMRLLPQPAGNIDQGNILFNDQDILNIPIKDMRNYRGRKISMIFQEPMTALNPVQSIGKQIGELYKIHFPKMDKKSIKKESIKILEEVGVPSSEQRLTQYPHELSGGLRQRVMIAMALACKPDVLIADEPTTAIDVTIQAQILDLMKKLQNDKGTAIIFITHDLGVVAQISDQIIVMYCGQVVERANVFDLFKSPKHPYTQGLLNSIPNLDNPNKIKLDTIDGMVPDLANLPKGCRFSNRCHLSKTICEESNTLLDKSFNNDDVRCLRWTESKNIYDKNVSKSK